MKNYHTHTAVALIHENLQELEGLYMDVAYKINTLKDAVSILRREANPGAAQAILVTIEELRVELDHIEADMMWELQNG